MSSLDLFLGTEFVATGNPSAAEAFLRENYSRNPDDFYAMEALAGCLSRIGRTGEAIGLLRAFLGSHPRHVNSTVLLAKLYTYAWVFGEAEALLERALDLSPDNADALIGLAILRIMQGAPPERVDRIWARVPSTMRGYGAEQVRINVIRRHDGREAAIARIRQYARGLSNLHEVTLSLAMLYAEASAYDLAVDLVRQLDFKTCAVGDLEIIVEIMLASGHYDEAIEVLSQTKLRDWAYHKRLGVALYHLGDLTAAHRAFGRSVELDPPSPAPYYWAAFTGMRRGPWEAFTQAYDCARTGFRKFPDSMALYKLLMRWSLLRMRFVDAVQFYWLRRRSARRSLPKSIELVERSLAVRR